MYTLYDTKTNMAQFTTYNSSVKRSNLIPSTTFDECFEVFLNDSSWDISKTDWGRTTINGKERNLLRSFKVCNSLKMYLNI